MPYLQRGEKNAFYFALKIIEGLAPLWMFERLRRQCFYKGIEGDSVVYFKLIYFILFKLNAYFKIIDLALFLK